jgi:general secretion pathway protein K
MASAGIHAAMAMLIKDKMTSDSDSLQEDWANQEVVTSLLLDIPFEDGKLTVTIQDELARIQVNTLVDPDGGRSFIEPQRLLWDRFLNWYVDQDEAFEEIEPATIINSLKDWMDSGDDDAITGLSGAESDYYSDLEPPYFSRNGPFKHPKEMLQVKGITPAFFSGTTETAGISKYITIYIEPAPDNPIRTQSGGKININTAELPVLVALLPPEVEDLAGEVVAYRQEMEGDTYVHDLSNPMWYKDVVGLGEIEMPPDLISTSSDLYRIVATAALNEIQIKVTAVIHRERQKETGKWICRMLSWEAE